MPSAPSFRRTAKSHHLLNGSYLRKTVPHYFQRNDPKFRLWRHKPFHKTDNNRDTKAAKTAIDCNEREAFDVKTNESAGKLHAHLERDFVMADGFYATFRKENFEDRRFDVRVFWQI